MNAKDFALRNKEIVHLKKSKLMTVPEIARRFDISPVRVYQILGDNNAGLRQEHGSCAQRNKQIVSEFLQHRDVGSIASKYKLSVSYVYCIIQENGISARQYKQRPKPEAIGLLLSDLLDPDETERYPCRIAVGRLPGNTCTEYNCYHGLNCEAFRKAAKKHPELVHLGQQHASGVGGSAL